MKKKIFRCEQCREKRVRHDGDLCKACIYKWGLGLEEQGRLLREACGDCRALLEDCLEVFDAMGSDTGDDFVRRIQHTLDERLPNPTYFASELGRPS